MDTYSTVVIVLVTFRRPNVAMTTIRGLKDNLEYPADKIGWHIADDGSGIDYINKLANEIGPNYQISVSDAARGGVGKSMNLGIEAALLRSDLWLHMEDDWNLVQKLDISSSVRLLVENDKVGMVRLNYLSTDVVGKVEGMSDELWWVLNRKCYHYTFSGGPSLRHRRFYEAYGAYEEGLGPGETEDNYCWKFNMSSGPAVVWPAWYPHRGYFRDIGGSSSFNKLHGNGISADEAADIFDRAGVS